VVSINRNKSKAINNNNNNNNKNNSNNNKKKVKLQNELESDDCYSVSSAIIDNNSNSNQKDIMIPIKRSSTTSKLKQKIKQIFPDNKNNNKCSNQKLKDNSNRTSIGENDEDHLKLSIDNRNTLYHHNINEPLIDSIKNDGNETIKAKLRRLAFGLGSYFVTCGSSRSNKIKKQTKDNNINEMYLDYNNDYAENDPMSTGQPNHNQFNEHGQDYSSNKIDKPKLTSSKTSHSFRSIKSLKNLKKNKSWSLLESGSNNELEQIIFHDESDKVLIL
jgi:hypothetical protein